MHVPVREQGGQRLDGAPVGQLAEGDDRMAALAPDEVGASGDVDQQLEAVRLTEAGQRPARPVALNARSRILISTMARAD
jgi:hypothetical protein